MAKLPACCGRVNARLVMDEANLARVAKMAAAAAEKGRDMTGWNEKIALCKANIAQDKQAIIDHEAEHAR